MKEKRTPQQVHADIQSGKYGDKTPGFDPAAAPMETDAEAGGSSTPARSEEPPGAVRPTTENEASSGSAMRPLRHERRSPENRTPEKRR